MDAVSPPPAFVLAVMMAEQQLADAYNCWNKAAL